MNFPLSAVHELERLAELYDEEFVAAAYRAILGRAPDAGGLNNYVAQVRSGVNKLQIVVELAQSAECRSRTPLPPGLNEFVKKHSVRRRTFLGRLRRPHEEQILTLERQLRAMDNHLYLVQRNLTQLFSEATDSMGLMHPAAVLRKKTDGDPNATSRWQVASHLLPKLRKTFGDLSHAISARR